MSKLSVEQHVEHDEKGASPEALLHLEAFEEVKGSTPAKELTESKELTQSTQLQAQQETAEQPAPTVKALERFELGDGRYLSFSPKEREFTSTQGKLVRFKDNKSKEFVVTLLNYNTGMANLTASTDLVRLLAQPHRYGHPNLIEFFSIAAEKEKAFSEFLQSLPDVGYLSVVICETKPAKLESNTLYVIKTEPTITVTAQNIDTPVTINTSKANYSELKQILAPLPLGKVADSAIAEQIKTLCGRNPSVSVSAPPTGFTKVILLPSIDKTPAKAGAQHVIPPPDHQLPTQPEQCAPNTFYIESASTFKGSITTITIRWALNGQLYSRKISEAEAGEAKLPDFPQSGEEPSHIQTPALLRNLESLCESTRPEKTEPGTLYIIKTKEKIIVSPQGLPSHDIVGPKYAELERLLRESKLATGKITDPTIVGQIRTLCGYNEMATFFARRDKAHHAVLGESDSVTAQCQAAKRLALLQEVICAAQAPGRDLATFFPEEIKVEPAQPADADISPFNRDIKPNIRTIILQAGRAISHFHCLGASHCDLGVTNFLFDPSTRRLTLIDPFAARKPTLQGTIIIEKEDKIAMAHNVTAGAEQIPPELLSVTPGEEKTLDGDCLDSFSFGVLIYQLLAMKRDVDIFGYRDQPPLPGDAKLDLATKLQRRYDALRQGAVRAQELKLAADPIEVAIVTAMKKDGMVFTEAEAKQPGKIYVDPATKDLLIGLLQLDPNKRLKISALFAHPYFQDWPERENEIHRGILTALSVNNMFMANQLFKTYITDTEKLEIFLEKALQYATEHADTNLRVRLSNLLSTKQTANKKDESLYEELQNYLESSMPTDKVDGETGRIDFCIHYIRRLQDKISTPLATVIITKLINDAANHIQNLMAGEQDSINKAILKTIGSLYARLQEIFNKFNDKDLTSQEKTFLYSEFRKVHQEIDALNTKAIARGNDWDPDSSTFPYQSPEINRNTRDAITQLHDITRVIAEHLQPKLFTQLYYLLPTIDADQELTSAAFTSALRDRNPTDPGFDDKNSHTDQQIQFIAAIQSHIKLDDDDSKKHTAAQIEFSAMLQLIDDMGNTYEDKQCDEYKILGDLKEILNDFKALKQKQSTLPLTDYESVQDKIFKAFREVTAKLEQKQKTAVEDGAKKSLKKLMEICGLVRNHIRPECFKNLDRLCHEKFAIPPSTLSIVEPVVVAESKATIQINGRIVKQDAINDTIEKRNHFVKVADPTSHCYRPSRSRSFRRPSATQQNPVMIAQQNTGVDSFTAFSHFSQSLTRLRKIIYPRQHAVADAIWRIFRKLGHFLGIAKENPSDYNSTRFFPGLHKTKHQQEMERTLNPTQPAESTNIAAPAA